MGRTLDELVRAGQLASVFCRLARTRFTGVIYAEHEDGGGIFSFRDGMPVYAEDLGDAPLLADDLLARGLIDSNQYGDIAARVIELGSEDEDLGFCEVAVQRGVLTQPQVDAELERRLRGRIIQAVGWSHCRIELDGDPESVDGIAQFPQDLGPLLATGVRTFCDENNVRELLGPLETLYVRPSVALAESVQFFDLGDEEEDVVSAIKPDLAVQKTIDESQIDWLEGWQLIVMLVIAEHVEVGRAPFAPVADRSGLRRSHAIDQAGGRYTASTGVRTERVSTGSLPRMPAVTESSASDAFPSAPPMRPEPAAKRAHEALRGTPAPQTPSTTSRAGTVRSEARAPEPRTPLSRAEPTPRPASSTTTPAVRPPAQPARPAPAAPSSARPIPRRDPKRKLSTALQRLERLRPVTPTAVSPPRASSGAVTAAGDAPNRAHVEALLRMREAKRTEASAGKADKPAEKPAGAPKAAADAFKQAQDLMRDNQWTRAHEQMRKVCELDGTNELYAMYQRWTALRSNLLDEDGMSKLRGALRDKLSDDELGKFAYYALGHLALAEKKDEAAEKFFRKALEMDKNNKDAERHLRIIELRRKSAKEQGNNKIFGIEIGKKKS